MRWKLRAAGRRERVKRPGILTSPRRRRDGDARRGDQDPAPGTSRRSCLPASIHQELATATVIDPHPGAIPSPAGTLGAARVGHALDQLHAAAATYVDHAHLVLVLVAVALQADRPVPARARLPAARAVSRAPIVRPAMPSLAKDAATAAIHPQPLPVHAPALAADARSLGFLL